MARPTIFAGLLALAFAFTGSAASQTATPEALAAAKELMVSMRVADQVNTMFPLIIQQLKPAIVQGRPAVERDFDALLPRFLQEVNARMSEFSDGIAEVYARHFTANEIRQIIAFYDGPVGQKFLQRMPQTMQESGLVGQRFAEKIARELVVKMRDELRKRGHNI